MSLTLSCKGKSESVALAELSDDLSGLYAAASTAFGLSLEDTTLKLIAKGKTLPPTGSIEATGLVKPGMKLMVMASKRQLVDELADRRSDPTVRGFEREDADAAKRCLEVGRASEMSEWGRVQLGEYRCCRLEPCTWQSFGTRAKSSVPHAFEARKMLLKLSTDPAVLRILAERRWTVGALGEMDPVDDRLAEKTHSQGKCLLGYNTNHGARIDVRLRTFDLDGFMPYPKLVETLLHELAHNMVGPHDEHFWHLFAQLKADYLRYHKQAAAAGTLHEGRSPLELAGVTQDVADVRGAVLRALEHDRQEGPVSQMQVGLLDGYLAATDMAIGGGGRTLAEGSGAASSGAGAGAGATREEMRALMAERAAARRDGGGGEGGASGGAGAGGSA